MKSLVFLLLSAAFFTIATANAQTSGAAPIPHVTYSVGFGPMGKMLSVKRGAPFSGVLIEQYEQTLQDGTRIAREDHEVVMRDGMGRIYRSRPVRKVGNAEGEPLQAVTIIDPVAGVQYYCSAFRKVCTRMRYQPPPASVRPHVTTPQKSRDITVEDLGTSNISGVDVEGKQITRVVPEGMLGNDRPLTTTEELWHSNELDVDIQLKRTDPRTGTHTTTMTEVNLGEPDASYFQIPEGYRVEERPNSVGVLGPAPAVSEPALSPQVPTKNQ